MFEPFFSILLRNNRHRKKCAYYLSPFLLAYTVVIITIIFVLIYVYMYTQELSPRVVSREGNFQS